MDDFVDGGSKGGNGGASDVKKAKLETKALKAKRPGFTDERYNETSYYHEPETGLRKVYPYYFTFTTFTKGRWVGEKILDVFAREFRAHPAEEYVSDKTNICRVKKSIKEFFIQFGLKKEKC